MERKKLQAKILLKIHSAYIRVLLNQENLLYLCGGFNTRRSFTATDGGGFMQQRRFCTAKTRVQKLTRRSIFELASGRHRSGMNVRVHS